MEVVQTDVQGQVGFELRRTPATFGEVVAVGRPEMDLADPDSVRVRVHETRPQLVVSAAGYTAVDKSETEPDRAVRINRDAPAVLAEEGRLLGAPTFGVSMPEWDCTFALCVADAGMYRKSA